MKLAVLILLFPGAMAFTLSSAQTWLASFQQPLRNFIDNPLRQSTIPQFLLDSRHPWILAHRRQLERLPNAAEFLCTELVDGRTALEMPPDLFDSLEVDNTRVGISRSGWANALERFGEISQCPRALERVKEMNLYIYVFDRPYSDRSIRLLEPPFPPPQLITLLGDVLESMHNLETLKYHIPKQYTHILGKFRARKLTLPHVKHLEPGPWSHYLVGMCPNLETLANGGGFEWYHGSLPDEFGYRFDWDFELINSTVSTPKLRQFSMVDGRNGWSPGLVSGMSVAEFSIQSTLNVLHFSFRVLSCLSTQRLSKQCLRSKV